MTRYLRTGLLLLTLGCARNDSVMPPDRDRLSLGSWGGEDASVVVEDSVAHVHVGCTFGNFAAPVTVDMNGRFDVAGSYVLRAFPVQFGPELPARFAGSLDGNRLVFTVTVNDTVQDEVRVLGPSSVFYKRDAKMRACPICRRDMR
jgi:hypothetical protein